VSSNINDYIKPIAPSPRRVVVNAPATATPKNDNLISFPERLAEAQAEASQRRMVSVPPGAPTVPYQGRREMELPNGELPLLDKNDPASKKLQERMIAKVKVFDLSVDAQVEECEKIWQKVCDSTAIVSSENIVFDDKNARYLMLLRWSEFEYKLPGT
jgi:hypothetical protein